MFNDSTSSAFYKILSAQSCSKPLSLSHSGSIFSKWQSGNPETHPAFPAIQTEKQEEIYALTRPGPHHRAVVAADAHRAVS
ncbi:hypothetical protein, partial [Victivallis vadensis]|uniref:hypothetical protein n=1 Tax=Victivallis vadensis TaxID=172901 RepID=UPI00266BC29A